MSHKKNIVKKPWGYEYLVYENNECALWHLYIKKDQKTSMHCHPSKTTGLVLVDGEATVSFLNNDFDLKPMDKIMIRKGLFHSTKASAKTGAIVFEIETPVDKNDLVRLRDSYGREGLPYEDSTFEAPKEEDCLWIENPAAGAKRTYRVANLKLTVCDVKSTDFFNDLEDGVNVMFLEGGIVTEYGTNVAGAGDIVSSNIVKELVQVFKSVKNKTIIMVMEEENEGG